MENKLERALAALRDCIELLEQLPTLNGLPGLAVLENAKDVLAECAEQGVVDVAAGDLLSKIEEMRRDFERKTVHLFSNQRVNEDIARLIQDVLVQSPFNPPPWRQISHEAPMAFGLGWEINKFRNEFLLDPPRIMPPEDIGHSVEFTIPKCETCYKFSSHGDDDSPQVHLCHLKEKACTTSPTGTCKFHLPKKVSERVIVEQALPVSKIAFPAYSKGDRPKCVSCVYMVDKLNGETTCHPFCARHKQNHYVDPNNMSCDAHSPIPTDQDLSK